VTNEKEGMEDMLGQLDQIFSGEKEVRQLALKRGDGQCSKSHSKENTGETSNEKTGESGTHPDGKAIKIRDA